MSRIPLDIYKGYTKLEAAAFSKTVGDKLEKDAADHYLFGLIPKRLNGYVLDLCCGNGKYSKILCVRGSDQILEQFLLFQHLSY